MSATITKNMNEKKFKYSINIDTEDLVNIYVKQWVLEWCKKYHPEAFVEAEKFVRDFMEKDN
jgi:predicted transcriptional regulator